MSRRRHQQEFGPKDRIAAFAEATEAYAETLDDPDLANVYWGKSLGLWQALAILAAEDGATSAVRPRRPAGSCSDRTDRRTAAEEPERRDAGGGSWRRSARPGRASSSAAPPAKDIDAELHWILADARLGGIAARRRGAR